MMIQHTLLKMLLSFSSLSMRTKITKISWLARFSVKTRVFVMIYSRRVMKRSLRLGLRLVKRKRMSLGMFSRLPNTNMYLKLSGNQRSITGKCQDLDRSWQFHWCTSHAFLRIPLMPPLLTGLRFPSSSRSKRKRSKNGKKIKSSKKKKRSKQVALGIQSQKNGKKSSQHHSSPRSISSLSALIHSVKTDSLLMNKNVSYCKQPQNSRKHGKSSRVRNSSKIGTQE